MSLATPGRSRAAWRAPRRPRVAETGSHPYFELLAHRALNPPPSSSLAEERTPPLPPPPCGGARFPTLAAMPKSSAVSALSLSKGLATPRQDVGPIEG